MVKKNVRVRSHVRKINGKLIRVKAHDRHISINPKKLEKYNVVNRTLFMKPRWKKYSNIVSFKSEIDANDSVGKLMDEFDSAKSLSKMKRVAQVAQLAENRALASSKRYEYGSKKRDELESISWVYECVSKYLWNCYNYEKKKDVR